MAGTALQLCLPVTLGMPVIELCRKAAQTCPCKTPVPAQTPRFPAQSGVSHGAVMPVLPEQGLQKFGTGRLRF